MRIISLFLNFNAEQTILFKNKLAFIWYLDYKKIYLKLFFQSNLGGRVSNLPNINKAYNIKINVFFYIVRMERVTIEVDHIFSLPVDILFF